MFFDGKTVLYICDTATRFSAAIFVDAHGSSYSQSAKGVQIALMR